MENQHPEEQMTAEELAARKEEMLQFYTDSLPYLEAQFKYEEMLMKLDEVRFKRTSIQMQFAMMMQGPSPEEQEEVSKENAQNKEQFRTVMQKTEESGKKRLKKS